MNVIKVTPRGYCQGVVSAISIAKKARESYQGPIYILGMIVHNTYVKKALELYHITSLDTSKKSKESYINELHEGVIIFTAHGIADRLYKAAEAKGLQIIDASCPHVIKTKNIIKEYLQKGFEILYIGKANHPEAEAIADLSSSVHVISEWKDIEELNLAKTSKLFVTNQTTMNFPDTVSLQTCIKENYTNAIIQEEICAATRLRQQAIIELENVDVLFVVGDSSSNNANQLLKQNKSISRKYLIDSVQDIDISLLKTNDCIAVSAAASTPTYLTNQVITYLQQLDLTMRSTWDKPEIDITKIL